MKMNWGLVLAMVLTSCVTKSKYAEVISSVKSKEKQQLKLVAERDNLLAKNQALKDSAMKIGGYDE
jgi:PBP1b-binding outer membrane lipoprotein LpoB